MIKTKVLALGVLILGSPALADPAATTAENGQNLALNCFTCHSAERGQGALIPSLRGRSAEVIRSMLLGFKADQGSPTIMNRIAKGYTDAQITAIADYLGEP